MKIAVYAISLNEAKFADRFMDACADADYIVIADTGSTDGSADIFRARGALVHDIRVQPWRFDSARNAALALVPVDVDVCISLDIDEVPSKGWRDQLEAAWVQGTTRASHMMVCSRLEDGSPGIHFMNERIHSRFGYTWRHICHEATYPDGIEEVRISLPDLCVDHLPDDSKSRGIYLPMLGRAVKEDPSSTRMAFYLAREYYYNQRYDEAILEFERYLDLNGYYVSERVSAMVYIGRCLMAQGKDPGAWLSRANGVQPNNREPLVVLAEHYYAQKDWPSCYATALRALKITDRPDGYIYDGRCYGYLPDDLASLGAWYIGLHDVAIEYARKALAYAPSDQRIIDNITFMTNHVQKQGDSKILSEVS